MKLKKQDIGVWVKASEELPKINTEYLIRLIGEEDCTNFTHFDGVKLTDHDKYFEWLKPLKEVYVLTDEELQAIKNEGYLIADATAEGSENWKAEYDNCLKILKDLIALKSHIEAYGKTDEYTETQPRVWDKAREFIAKYQHL